MGHSPGSMEKSSHAYFMSRLIEPRLAPALALALESERAMVARYCRYLYQHRSPAVETKIQFDRRAHPGSNEVFDPKLQIQ
jgi:hypothetical protein